MLPGALHISEGIFPFFNMRYSSDFILKALAIILLFLFFFTVGYFSKKMPNSFEKYPRTLTPKKSNLINIKIILGILFFISLTTSFSIGLEYLSTSRGERVMFDPLTPQQLIIVNLSRISSFLCVVYSLVFYRFSNDRTRYFLLLSSLLIFLLINNPITLPRFVVASYVFTLIFIFIKMTISRRLYLLCGILFGQVTIFPLLSILSRGNIEEFFEVGIMDYFTKSGDFDGVQSIINVAIMGDQQGLEYGRSLLSAAFFYIPRDWWSSKSIGLGGESASFVGYPFINISSPLPAEFYIDFGYFSLFILSFLFGRVLRQLDNLFIKYSRLNNFDSMLKKVPLAIFCGYLMIILRGSLIGILGPVVISLSLTIICNKFILSRVKNGKY